MAKKGSSGKVKARKSSKLSVKKKTLKDIGPKGEVQGGLRKLEYTYLTCPPTRATCA